MYDSCKTISYLKDMTVINESDKAEYVYMVMQGNFNAFKLYSTKNLKKLNQDSFASSFKKLLLEKNPHMINSNRLDELHNSEHVVEYVKFKTFGVGDIFGHEALVNNEYYQMRVSCATHKGSLMLINKEQYLSYSKLSNAKKMAIEDAI